MSKDMRKEVLERIEEKRKEYQTLQKNLARLQELQENPLIKEYFSLHEQVETYLDGISLEEDIPFLRPVDYEQISKNIAKEPLKKAFSNPLITNCTCDILIEYGKSGLFREPAILRYVCLNCGKCTSITKKEQRKFEKGKIIIPINYPDVRAIDFYQIRKRYIELLQELPCIEAAEVLKEELKSQEKAFQRN